MKLVNFFIFFILTLSLSANISCKGYELADNINLLNNSGSLAGQTVMHFHLHVLPRYVDDEINFHQVDHEPNFEKLDELYSILTK